MTFHEHDHHHSRVAGSPAAQGLRWAAAALCALTVHAGAAWWLTRPAPPLAISEQAPASLEVDTSLLGFAAADQVSSGEELEAVEPMPQEAEAIPTEAAPVQPVEPAVKPTETTEPTPRETQPVLPAETPIQAPDVVAPSEVQISAATPVERNEPIEPAIEPIQPVDEELLVDIPEEAPRPTPRPEPVRTAETRQVQPKPTRPEPVQRERRRPVPQAGNRGQNNADVRQGQAEGSTAGRANASQARGDARSRRAGSAAVSNYPGQVASKLRRALRFPRGARGTRGEVHVAFTVTGGGGVSGARIARSSGHPVLDRAALETVQRAAPFPPIPADAGRSSWSFTVPLAFTR